jgi:formylmethanofuran dehydrogenase subunit D
MAKKFLLIPGRSSRQGVTLNEGKYTDGYLDETSTLRMHPDDMRRLGIVQGDEVRMWNDVGEVVVPCIDAKDECPEGLVFICYGDKSSQLMSGETHGTGMPDSKALDVFIHPASEARPADPVCDSVQDSVPAQVLKPTTPVTTTSKSAVKPENNPAPATTKPVATSNPYAAATPSQSASNNGIGPTLVMGLFVVALIVLAIVMNLGG